MQIMLNTNDNNEFKSFLSISGFRQLVKQPTRLTDNSSTIIDIIASNKENIKRLIVIPTAFSDYDKLFHHSTKYY